MIEVTAEMERAYKRARKAAKEAAQVMNCSEHGMGDCPYHQVPGAGRRAGLTAVLAIVERDWNMQPRPDIVVHLLTAGDEYVHCCGREIADLPEGERTTLNPHGVTCGGAS